jgi:hypothetical protein
MTAKNDQARTEPECRTCEDWGTVVIESEGDLREVACPDHDGAVEIPERVRVAECTVGTRPGEPTLCVGDVVRVRDEEVMSVVVLPTDGPADCEPDEIPDVAICCVPIALVRTPPDGEALRWVEISDLTRAVSGEAGAAA